MKKQTVYAKCLQEGQVFEHVEWCPWINCDPADKLLSRLILNKWIRERGGIGADEKISVTVYTYDESTPRHANGKPMACNGTTYAIAGRDAA